MDEVMSKEEKGIHIKPKRILPSEEQKQQQQQLAPHQPSLSSPRLIMWISAADDTG